jgi:hypothetical protein
VLGEAVDTGEDCVLLDPETFETVVTKSRRDRPLVVERLY